ncbi:MAG: zf-HC2 domain-containing protein [Nitriliruptorales bacterium]|nr:zf-HC2 domain-containing protein [Nitriliruptorales bacterium]
MRDWHQDRHDRTQRQLPRFVAEELPAWRRRLVERHLASCASCTQELARQREVSARLADIGSSAAAATEDASAPDDLLDRLLEQAREPDLRARAAVPARAAISGERPELAAAFAATILAMLAVAVWAGWRIGRWWGSRD